MAEKSKLHELKGVEIFATGKWNGDKYTEADLDEMVKAFAETKEKIKPFAKLGHDDSQFLAQQDGFPAVGWVTNVYRSGKKLIADFADVPDKIYQLIMNKAYRRVSSEIYWNMKLGEKVYKRVLAAVAFLGGDTPAVTNLTDILDLYGLTTENLVKYENDHDTHIYNLEHTDLEGEQMEELQKKYDELDQEYKTYKEDNEKKNLEIKEASDAVAKQIEELKKENEELKSYKEGSEEEKAQLMAEKRDAEMEKLLDAFQNDKLITKASRPYVKELLADEKKEYSFGDEEKLDKENLIKKIFDLHKEAFSAVNFDESSQNNETKEKSEDEKIKQYMKDNKCDYKEAYRALVK